MAVALGIDIGGTGIKGAPVDLSTGRMTQARFRILTPHPATPDAVSATVAKVAAHFPGRGPVGCTFPAVVRAGITLSAAHVDSGWIDADAAKILGDAVGRHVNVMNDADAAGLAEMRFGAGRGQHGVVLLLTFGTGIGSALFVDGQLVPNMQLGHIQVDGKDAELRASDAVRQEKHMSWRRWARRVNHYLERVEVMCVPDLIIIGGGASESAEHFLPRLRARAKIVTAGLRNEAGIIGAAMAGAGLGVERRSGSRK